MNTVLSVLSVVFWGVMLLSVLVMIHEGGHYLAARAFGVRVTEFFLGLPSRWKLSRRSRGHGTEYGVTPFLLGGYNRICGMEYSDDALLARAFSIVQREGRVSAEDVAQELEIDIDRSYSLMVSLSDLAAIRPYYDPELGEYPAQRNYPERFETVARDANLLTVYDKGHDFDAPGATLDAQPRPLCDAEGQLATEVGRTYAGISFLKRIVILIAGPLTNLLLAFVLVTSAYMTMEYSVPLNTNVLGEVHEGSLAEAAGLEAGDVVLSVDGTEVADWDGVSQAMSAAREKGEDFEVVYERDGARRTALVDMPEGDKVELVGVSPQVEPYHLTLFEAMRGAVGYAGMVADVALRLIMPQHTMEVLDQSTSIVGISVMASQAVSAGVMDVIAIMAAVSMSLGFMNLLPIPPLDGGKMIMEVVELVLRRPLSMKARMAVSYVGIAFFVFVFVVVLRNDLLRYVIG